MAPNILRLLYSGWTRITSVTVTFRLGVLQLGASGWAAKQQMPSACLRGPLLLSQTSRLQGPLEIMGLLDFPFYGWERQRFAALPGHCSWQEESGLLGESNAGVIRNEGHQGVISEGDG